MYCESFGLRFPPFEDRTDPQFLFSTPEMEETLAVLEYTCRQGGSAALVLGDAGSGKTLLLRSLVLRLQKTDQVIAISCPPGMETEPVREICKRLKIGLPRGSDRARALSRLRRHLARQRQENRHFILTVDQAENLTPSGLSSLGALIDLQDEQGRLLTALVGGQPRFAQILNDPTFAAVKQLLFWQRVLSPLTLSQTKEYIYHRLRIAGAVDDDWFEEAAVNRIHEASRGIPRLINRMCDAALLAAYGAGKRYVTLSLLVGTAGPPERRSSESQTVPLNGTHSETADDAVADPPTSQPRSWTAPTGPTAFPITTVPVQETVLRGGPSFEEATRLRNRVADPCETSEEGGARAVETLLATGENLFARLEQVLARADLIAGRSETALAQQTAIEARFDGLSYKAKESTEQLARMVGEANQCLVRLESRVQTSIPDVERRLSTLTGRVTNHCADVEQQTTQLSEVCRRADGASHRLLLMTTQLAKQLEEAPIRTTQLETVTDIAQQERSGIEHLLERLRTSNSDGEERLNAQRQEFHKLLEDLPARGQKAAAELEQNQSRLHRALDERERELDELANRVRAQVTDAARDAQSVRNEVSTIREQSQRNEQIRADLEVRLDQAESVAANLGLATQKALETQTTLAENLHQASQSVAESATQQKQVETHLAALGAENRLGLQLLERLAPLSQQYHESETRAQELTDRCQRAMEALRSQLTDAEKASARIDTQRTEADESSHRLTEMDSIVQTTQITAEATLAEMGQQLDQLRTAQQDGQEFLAKLDKAKSGTVTLTNYFEQTRQTVESLLARADTSVQTMTDQIQSGEKTVKHLQDGQSDATETMERMREGNNAALMTMDQTLAVAAQAEAKSAELERVNASADRLRSQLAETSLGYEKTAQTMESEVRKAQDSARLAAEQIERLIQDAWGLTGRMEAIAKETGERSAQGFELVATLRELSDPSRQLIGQLQEAVEQAKVHAAGVAWGCGQARKVVHRLSSVTRLLPSARTAESSLRATVSEAQGIHGAITAATEGTVHVVDQLQTLCTSAQTLIDGHERLRKDAEGTQTRLQEQMAAHRVSSEHGERLLDDFIHRAEQIAHQVDDLQNTVGQLQQSVDQTTAQTGDATKVASAQAAQLSKVCSVVRKVLSALAQSGLQARQQTVELQQAERQASDKLSRLASQTQLAVGSLREWVAEAARVQERLAGTVRACPGIDLTHPVSAIQRFWDENPMPSQNSPKTAREDWARGGGRPIDPTPSDPKRRLSAPPTDEISRLIEEAKEAPLSRSI
ncbi:MAG: AAA family ATPase [Planctomycetota bacterium]